MRLGYPQQHARTRKFGSNHDFRSGARRGSFHVSGISASSTRTRPTRGVRRPHAGREEPRGPDVCSVPGGTSFAQARIVSYAGKNCCEMARSAHLRSKICSRRGLFRCEGGEFALGVVQTDCFRAKSHPRRAYFASNGAQRCLSPARSPSRRSDLPFAVSKIALSPRCLPCVI